MNPEEGQQIDLVAWAAELEEERVRVEEVNEERVRSRAAVACARIWRRGITAISSPMLGGWPR